MPDTQPPSLGPESADNQGFLRLNWRQPPDSAQPMLLFVPPESDVVADLAEAMRELGVTVEVWALDTAITSRRKRLAELQRLHASSLTGRPEPWVGVIPFDLWAARSA